MRGKPAHEVAKRFKQYLTFTAARSHFERINFETAHDRIVGSSFEWIHRGSMEIC